MRTILVAALALTLISCSEQKPAQPAAAQAPKPAVQKEAALPPGHPTMPAAVAQEASGKPVSGKVLEASSAAGFTYVRLETSNGPEWFIVAPVELKKGDKLTVQPNMTMDNFESKSLKKTFDRVTFATVVNGGTPAKAAEFPPAMMEALARQQGGGHAAEPARSAETPVKVEKAEGGKSVAELWASRATLKDSNVVVRGKVVKSLAGIMGKNWIHLQDGSGSAAAGDNDITVTTSENIKAGEVITIRGVVRVDKDFGAGYKYPVIVEDASVVR
jgi:hypothetical protein